MYFTLTVFIFAGGYIDFPFQQVNVNTSHFAMLHSTVTWFVIYAGYGIIVSIASHEYTCICFVNTNSI